MLQKKFNLFLKDKINDYNKVIVVDPDKSISIRSFLIGALSENISNVKNVLESHDVLSTIHCLKKLGANIKSVRLKYGNSYSISFDDLDKYSRKILKHNPYAFVKRIK